MCVCVAATSRVGKANRKSSRSHRYIDLVAGKIRTYLKNLVEQQTRDKLISFRHLHIKKRENYVANKIYKRNSTEQPVKEYSLQNDQDADLAGASNCSRTMFVAGVMSREHKQPNKHSEQSNTRPT